MPFQIRDQNSQTLVSTEVLAAALHHQDAEGNCPLGLGLGQTMLCLS